MTPKLNPEKITAENPEATAEWFEKARPASDVLPDLFDKSTVTKMLQPKNRGRPVSVKTKMPVNIRLDPDIVNAFKKSGAGWQTKINDALKDWLKTHPHPY